MTASSPKTKSSPQKNSSPATTDTFPTTNSPSKTDNSTNITSNVLVVSRPSAEDLVNLERELQKLISCKLQADTNLVKIETRLYDLETEYLMETQSFGNLIHGIEGYLGLPPSIPASNGPIRRGQFNNSNSSLSTMTSHNSTSVITPASLVNPQQRIFSSTSTTFQKSLAAIGRLSEAIANGYVVPSDGNNSSDLTSLTGIIRTSSKYNETKKLTSTSSPNKISLAGVNKNKKSTESAEWQPPSMKSSRKK